MIEVLLVNDKDRITGEGEKLDVHRKGLLHRAFSVFLADEEDRLLIQKRAEDKYHSGGVWSNSCCSHQYSGETLFEAASRCIRDGLRFSIVSFNDSILLSSLSSLESVSNSSTLNRALISISLPEIIE